MEVVTHKGCWEWHYIKNKDGEICFSGCWPTGSLLASRENGKHWCLALLRAPWLNALFWKGQPKLIANRAGQSAVGGGEQINAALCKCFLQPQHTTPEMVVWSKSSYKTSALTDDLNHLGCSEGTGQTEFVKISNEVFYRFLRNFLLYLLITVTGKSSS